MWLCVNENSETAMLLLHRGATRTFDEPRMGAHVIHTAAVTGHLEAVQYLLQGENAVDINIMYSRGLTPLYYAYSNREKETMLWLLNNGAAVDDEIGNGITLLHLACLDGAFAIACRLIDAGADVNRPLPEGVCPYPGQLRPLELCCALHHTKARRAYAADASHHERRFERRRLELMTKLLDAGALLDPVPAPPRPENEHRPLPQISAVTIAASLHSIPMLELLLSAGADMALGTSAVHQAVYPAFMEWRASPPNPLPTLRWLLAHGAQVERGMELMSDALAIVCSYPADTPWKLDVLRWFIGQGVPCDTEGYMYGVRPHRRLHPTYTGPFSPQEYPSSPLLEALLQRDFIACRIILDSSPCLSLVWTFHHLLSESESVWRGGSVSTRPESVEAILDKNGEMMAFLLSVDKKESIKYDPQEFLSLREEHGFPSL